MRVARRRLWRPRVGAVEEVTGAEPYHQGVLAALAARDWRPMHLGRDFAVRHDGTGANFSGDPKPAAHDR